jgi:uncharacterized protein YndB with AHSA1/START domain
VTNPSPSAFKPADAPADEREIVFSRTLKAPRALVFKAFTESAHVGHWWGPKGFTTTTHEMDVRPGGAWRYMMHGPDGVDYPNRIVYAEVVAPERLVYTHDGDVEDDPNAFHVTVTFDEREGRTVLTMRSRFASAAVRDQVAVFAIPGGRETLDRLEAYVAQL